ncbi:MAG: oligosaccharide flippase family protein [Cloacibacterium sp.]|nr:oligosaccharide flippase family protein [Cloacibacterium sp.]
MSIIARQGFKYSIIGYLGFLLGTFSALFVFPHDLEFYGKLRYILPTAEMMLPIVVFGLSFSNVKFFYTTQKDGRHQNLLSLSLVGIVFNFVLFTVLYFVSAEVFPSLKESEHWQMKRLILPLILVLAISAVLNKYISNYKRIVIPNIFENFFPKIANLGAFCLFFFIGFPEKFSYAFFFGVFVVAMLGYIWYSNKLEKITPDFSTGYFRKNKFWLEILSYSFFGFLGNIGSFVALKIDNFMIGEYLSFEENGLYSNIYSIVTLINIPQMGLYNISAPIINKHLAERSLEELNQFHKKTSLSLFFLGMVLFSCILVGFPFLTDFIKNGELFKEAEPIVWIIGIAMLFDLATGFNGHIISLSQYYRFNTFSMLILACLTVGLNALFIYYTDLGILGIAIAYATSLTIFNLIKISFNYYIFKVFPLSMNMILAMILCSLSVTVTILLPNFSHSLINLVYKPLLVLIMVFVGNHFLKIYPVEKFLNKDFFRSLLKF